MFTVCQMDVSNGFHWLHPLWQLHLLLQDWNNVLCLRDRQDWDPEPEVHGQAPNFNEQPITNLKGDNDPNDLLGLWNPRAQHLRHDLLSEHINHPSPVCRPCWVVRSHVPIMPPCWLLRHRQTIRSTQHRGVRWLGLWKWRRTASPIMRLLSPIIGYQIDWRGQPATQPLHSHVRGRIARTEKHINLKDVMQLHIKARDRLWVPLHIVTLCPKFVSKDSVY